MLAGAVTVFLLLGAAVADTNSVTAAQSVDGHRSWQIGSGPEWAGRKLAGSNSVNTAQSVDGHRSWQIGSDPSFGHRKLAGSNSVNAAESTDGHRSWQIGADPSFGHRKLADSKVPQGCADATGKFGGDPNCGQTWPGKKLLASAEIRPVEAATAAATSQSGLVAKMGERRLLTDTPAAAAAKPTTTAAAKPTSTAAAVNTAAVKAPTDKKSSDVAAAAVGTSTPATAPKKINQSISQRLRAMFSPRRHRASHPAAPVKAAATSQNKVVDVKSDKTNTPKVKESALRGSWGYYSPWGVYRTAYSTAGWGGPSACAAADVAMSCSYGRKLRMMLKL